jgi:hypothetical protein
MNLYKEMNYWAGLAFLPKLQQILSNFLNLFASFSRENQLIKVTDVGSQSVLLYIIWLVVCIYSGLVENLNKYTF